MHPRHVDECLHRLTVRANEMNRETNSHDNPLLDWIVEQITIEGPVTFARFMEWALYHPEYGYYSAGPALGPRGDFTTSPEASPAFGKLLARHVIEIDALLDKPDPLHLIECGPGNGTLAADLLEALAGAAPSLYQRVHYWLVEVSAALAARQKSLLLAQYSPKMQWVTDLSAIPPGCDGALIANEVVDAFPVHVLENVNGRLAEHFVDLGGGEDARIRIRFGEPSSSALTNFLTRYSIDLQPGQKVEINLAISGWIGQVADVLRRGVATVIDYGDISPARYSDARLEGTLLGYFGGSVTDNLLAHPGRQDLTALVDFTALADDAALVGLTKVAITRQVNFLLGLGLGTTLTAENGGMGLGSALRDRRGLQALVSPEGLGKFHVLLLSKGLDPGTTAAALSGLQYADIRT